MQPPQSSGGRNRTVCWQAQLFPILFSCCRSRDAAAAEGRPRRDGLCAEPDHGDRDAHRRSARSCRKKPPLLNVYTTATTTVAAARLRARTGNVGGEEAEWGGQGEEYRIAAHHTCFGPTPYRAHVVCPPLLRVFCGLLLRRLPAQLNNYSAACRDGPTEHHHRRHRSPCLRCALPSQAPARGLTLRGPFVAFPPASSLRAGVIIIPVVSMFPWLFVKFLSCLRRRTTLGRRARDSFGNAVT